MCDALLLFVRRIRSCGIGFGVLFVDVRHRDIQELRDIFANAPVDRILVETDSPYLAPMPYRGKRNEPAYTAHTAQVGAEIFNMEYAEFAHQTTQNFNTLFSKAAL